LSSFINGQSEILQSHMHYLPIKQDLIATNAMRSLPWTAINQTITLRLNKNLASSILEIADVQKF
jgi:hypothetical protein